MPKFRLSNEQNDAVIINVTSFDDLKAYLNQHFIPENMELIWDQQVNQAIPTTAIKNIEAID